MYKKSQLDRLNRIAALLRVATTCLLALASLITMVIVAPVMSTLAQMVLSLGMLVFVWWYAVMQLRKRASKRRVDAPDTGNYSLDFDRL